MFSWEGWYPVGQHGGAGAVLLAVEEILDDHISFPIFRSKNHTFEITYADTKCERSVGLPLVAEMHFGYGFPAVDAFIGPDCSVICEPSGHLVKKWNVPMISHICTSTKLSDKNLYPTFARTVAPSYRTAPFFARMMTYFGFDRAVIYYASDQIQVLSAVAIRNEFEKTGIIVADSILFIPGPEGKEQEFRAISEAKSKAKGKTHVLWA